MASPKSQMKQEAGRSLPITVAKKDISWPGIAGFGTALGALTKDNKFAGGTDGLVGIDGMTGVSGVTGFACGALDTTMVVVAYEETVPSEAVTLTTYVPGDEKVCLVEASDDLVLSPKSHWYIEGCLTLPVIVTEKETSWPTRAREGAFFKFVAIVEFASNIHK